MVYSPGRVFPALEVSFGSLSESYYYSRQTAPNNMFVVAALHKGLTGVRMFHEKTPTNVLAFLKAYNNEFHGGSSWTFLEMLEEALQFEMEWTSHRTSKGISSKAPNYVTVYWDFVKERIHGRFKSWNQFDNAKSLSHTLKPYGIYEEMIEWSGKCCDFLHERLNNATVPYPLVAFQLCQCMCVFQSCEQSGWSRHVAM